MSYRPHQSFVAPARGAPDLWRTLAGCVLTVIAGIALYQAAFALVSNILGPETMQRIVDATSFERRSATSALYSLYTFGFFGVGLAMAVNGLHGRRIGTLFGPWEAVVSDFLRVLYSVGGLLLLLWAVLPQDYETLRNAAMPRGTWLLLLPLSLTAVLVQAGTEELFFRGYLQQQFAARFPTTPLWMIVPSLAFGLLHLAPGVAGANAPLYMLWATCFGLAAADLTARTGAIGAAIGFHVANNIASVLLVSVAGPGSGLALYHIPLQMDDPRVGALMLPEIAATFCCWLAARLALKV